MYLKEVFKDLNYEGNNWKYSISNYGRVYNNKDNKFVAQVLTGEPQYWYVNLQFEGCKRILRRVHNLLARTVKRE